MIDKLEFETDNTPSDIKDNIIRDGINDFNNKLHNDPVSHHSIYAKINGDIIGGALIYQHSDAIYIDSLWVDEQFRNQGIGTELLKRSEQNALRQGILKQVICTFHKPNMEFYLRRGFKLIATVPEYIQGLDKYYLRKTISKNSVKNVYNKISDWFDSARTKDLSLERKILNMVEPLLPSGASLLDVGCGSGEPIAHYFIEKGFQVTGIDNAENMLALCQKRFPNHTWLNMDMRNLRLSEHFDCIIAWHSFFHIPREQQKDTLKAFAAHLKPGGVIVFTSGPANGESWSNNGGEMLFHASLSSSEYKKILLDIQMKVITHNVNDIDCGGATVWVAQKN